MKTLEVIAAKQINGGSRLGFDGVQDPIILTDDGPIIIDPAPPINTLDILQKVIPLVKMPRASFARI